MVHVGQKVICVDDVFLSKGWEKVANKPVRGCEYTIRDTFLEHYRGCGEVPSVYLCEIVNAPNMVSGMPGAPVHEWGFPADRFRPVQPRMTDISVFTEMLNPRSLTKAL